MSGPYAAATLQGHCNGLDQELTELARLARPRVRHWWGRRWLDGQYGAYCYLCDRHVATWSSRWPMTEQARLRLGLHRTFHLQGRLDTLPIATEETT